MGRRPTGLVVEDALTDEESARRTRPLQDGQALSKRVHACAQSAQHPPPPPRRARDQVYPLFAFSSHTYARAGEAAGWIGKAGQHLWLTHQNGR